MAIDITALYCCLDDFSKLFAEWEAHRLIPSEQTRQRTGKLSRSEMLFIMVLFHLSPFKHFKAFYRYGIGHQYRDCFGDLPRYDRFVSLMPWLFALGVSKTWGATPRAGLVGGQSVRPAARL
jgi:hypothetical protein